MHLDFTLSYSNRSTPCRIHRILIALCVVLCMVTSVLLGRTLVSCPLPEYPSLFVECSYSDSCHFLSLFILQPHGVTCLPSFSVSQSFHRPIPHPLRLPAFVSPENSWLSFKTWPTSCGKASLSFPPQRGQGAGGSGRLYIYSTFRNPHSARHVLGRGTALHSSHCSRVRGR